jgi:chaperone modulatory protein CbpM
MISRETFLVQARITHEEMAFYLEAGWITVRGHDGGFAEADLARAELIRTLREDCGCNAEGIDVALKLLDQLHGTRAALARLSAVLAVLPPPLRDQVAAAIRTTGPGNSE